MLRKQRFQDFIGYAVIGQQVRLETRPVVNGWAAGKQSHKRQPIPRMHFGLKSRTCATPDPLSAPRCPTFPKLADRLSKSPLATPPNSEDLDVFHQNPASRGFSS